MTRLHRRDFMRSSTALAAVPVLGSLSPNEKIRIGMIGMRGRGGSLLNGFLSRADVDVLMVCDIDSTVLARGASTVEKSRGTPPERVVDFRTILDNPSIDAIVLGTPDHWHAIPTILACQANKHVYVEKPAGHNILEGHRMLLAARQHRRVVQVGCQSRSGRHHADAMNYIRSGALGKVTFARAWESSRQSGLGFPKDGPVPNGVDYDKWLGPAPVRPFNRLRFHGSWRWFFDYGSGDLGNDGVHRIDIARRALEAGFVAQGMKLPDWPRAVSASGGKYVFDDAQQWPDTQLVTWEYPGATMVYEMRIWNGYRFEGESEGAAVYGTEGYVVIGNRSWRGYGPKGEPLEVGTKSPNSEHDAAHKQNFIDCIKSGKLPSFDIYQAHITSSMCHMGNTAWRTGEKLRFDPKSNSYAGNQKASEFVSREYRKPYRLPELNA